MQSLACERERPRDKLIVDLDLNLYRILYLEMLESQKTKTFRACGSSWD